MTVIADGITLLTNLGLLPYALAAATVGVGIAIWRGVRRG